MQRHVEAEREKVRSPAAKGYKVCRMHGAGGGAPKGNRNALKHGAPRRRRSRRGARLQR
jgi:uncharacterized protein YjcR